MMDASSVDTLRMAIAQNRLLWLWGDVPFPPESAAEPRAAIYKRWQTQARHLKPLGWPLATLPSAPWLSLDPTPRLVTALSALHATIWPLGGDVDTGAGLLIHWEDVRHLPHHPQKSEYLAQACAVCAGGVIVVLAAGDGLTFGRIWQSGLGSVLLAAAPLLVLGIGPGPWPPGIIPLAETLEPFVAALRSPIVRHNPTEEPPMNEIYTDFELHITPQGHATARSEEGDSPSVPVATAVPTALRLTQELIEQRKTNVELLRIFGQGLYELLFPGPIHAHLQQTEAAARAHGAKLRLRLRIEHDALASLPLEFLYRALGGYFFAINPGTVLSRYLNVPLPMQRATRGDRPLHLLTIIADPTDQVRLPPAEWEAIVRDALKTPLAQKLLTLQVVKRATRREIRDALLEKKPDMVQFVGHGIYENGKGSLALVDDKSNQTWLVDDERFASMFLGADDHLGLVSLATCESAKSDSPQGFLGIAPRIVQRGVPAVIAMQYSVFIKTAQIFLEDFYTSLAASKPLDWAVQAARNAISQDLGLDNREFATPVLFMRAKDGRVF